MGRIKTARIKRITKDLLKAYGERFTSDFVQNKAVLAEISTMPNKKTRNTVAGYATRLKRVADRS